MKNLIQYLGQPVKTLFNSTEFRLSVNTIIDGNVDLNESTNSTIYVDSTRTSEGYNRTGNILTPFNTITDAYNAAVASGYNDSNPAFIVLLSNITENVTK